MPSISILLSVDNKQEPYLSNPSLWVNKTCKLKGEIIEIQRNNLTGCTITLIDSGDFDNLCGHQ